MRRMAEFSALVRNDKDEIHRMSERHTDLWIRASLGITVGEYSRLVMEGIYGSSVMQNPERRDEVKSAA